MKLQWLRWLSVAFSVIAVGLLDSARHAFLADYLNGWPSTALMLVVITLGATAVSGLVFQFFARREQRLIAAAQELSTMSAIATTTGQPLDLSEIMYSTLSRVQNLLGAEAGVIYVTEEQTGGLVVAGQSGVSEKFGSLVAQLVESSSCKIQPDSTPLTQAVCSGKVVFAENLGKGNNPLEVLAKEEGLKAYGCVPLSSRDRVVGVMLIGARLKPRLEYDKDFLLSVGHHMGVVIDNTRLLWETQLREREIEALYKVGTEISALLELDKILASVVDKARWLVGTEVAALSLLDEQTQELFMRATSGARTDAFKEVRLKVGQGLAGHVVGTGQPVQAEDTMTGLNATPELVHVVKDEGLRSQLAVPLRIGGKPCGALYVGDRDSRRFTQRDVDLLSGLATQAAIAIENAQLYERAQHVAVLEERDRIAREMHDTLAQVLGYLGLKAKATGALLARGQYNEVEVELDEMGRVADEAYTDVRETILGLKESISPSLGLAGTLSEYVQKFSRQSGISTKVVVSSGEVNRLSPAVEVQLVRVIQEALTNVRKHARAKRAWVRLERENGSAMVTIEDDGQGFDLSRVDMHMGQHFGIQTMRERIEGVGGKLTIESSQGGGTRVIAKLPLTQEVGGL